MTQEDKELLLQDLCSRLPYGVKIETEYFTKATLVEIRKNISYGACKDLLVTYDISGEETPYQSDERSSTISKIKPYLFPLSSMTEEQKIECFRGVDIELDDYNEIWSKFPITNDDIILTNIRDWLKVIDWLIKNHFDYRGFIDREIVKDATNLNIY